ncbi:hypothetical protein [Subtercola boreus]|uniref:Ig-like domain-containing protein n=1 Tax=Subtercola boreus TaxID=120213 RepID=A0A3E0WCK1_9MICO|nr:hypothetical protein [Subtercola boreus]RFA22084.1 hypothetical protein B7R24_05205 [Subtercola boreus]RFA22264.1 hypothetical protein B7R23_05150 [Subtercola boreus]RFA28127.1 hypothetical protein B7R25_05275 [Subtercola boreus]
MFAQGLKKTGRVAAGVVVTAALALTGAVSATAAVPAATTAITTVAATSTAAANSTASTVAAAATITPPSPPVSLELTEFPGRDGVIWLEVVKAGSHGSATLDQLSYLYDLNGDGVWRQPDYGYKPGSDDFGVVASKGIVEGHTYSIRLIARATIKGRIYDSVPSAAVSTYVFNELALTYSPKTVVSGDTVTVSWDLTQSLHGQRADITFGTDPDLGVGGPVGPVGSVTLRPGYSTTVTATLNVIGENLDFDYRDYSTTVTTGAASSGAPLTQTPKPTIVGDPLVGSVLTAQAGTWKPQPVTLSYQWSRNGAAIAGATRSQYTLVTADAGARVTVAVTGRTPSGASATVASSPTETVAARVITGVQNYLNGTQIVGYTLYAETRGVSPLGVAFTYQWLSDGAPIAGDTKAVHQVVPADVGHRISLAITARKTGYPTVSLVTYETDPVEAAK